MKNCITIKLTKEEIILKILEDTTHEEVMECLGAKIEELSRLYQNEKTPMFITGKVLNTDEMEEIRASIQKEIDVKIEFDSPTTLGLHGIKKSFIKDIDSSATKFHRGSLRSGNRIEFEGSIVIIGDVNGGAEVIAGENVVILGNLRGLAHAGAKGNKKAIIAALQIDAPQIRISNIVKEIEKEEYERELGKTYAYVEGENIVLE